MKTIITHHYTNPELEAKIEKTELGLSTFAEVQGKQNGIDNIPNTEEEYKTLVLNKIEAELKHTIEEANATNLAGSGMILAQKLDTESKDRIQPLVGKQNDLEHQIKSLESKKKELHPSRKENIWQWAVIIGLTLIAISEGYFAYEALRNSGMSFLLSLVSFFAVAITVGLVTHVVVSYIKRMDIRVHKICAMIAVSVIAFIGFYFLGTLRADGYQIVQDMNLSVAKHKHFTTGISGIKLTIISFILFEAGLLLAYFFGKTKEEHEKDKAYGKICNELRHCNKKSKVLGLEIKAIKKESSEEIKVALMKYEYIAYTRKRLNAVAVNIAQKYIETNIRYRTDKQIPAFFSYPPTFNF
ncbi:MAG: hypothetical protein IPI46_13825 [Bacteroidetes bacterium]|nr:hypothetical protein [Bacteroidota bacterium]